MNEEKVSKPNNKKTKIIIVLVILLILFICLFAYLLINLKSKQNIDHIINIENINEESIPSNINNNEEDDKIKEGNNKNELIIDNQKYKDYLKIIPIGYESFIINVYEEYSILLDSDISIKTDYHVLLKDAYSGKKETIQTVSPFSYLPIAYMLSKESPKFIVTASFCGDAPCEANKYVTIDDFSSKLKELYNVNAPTRDIFFTGGGAAQKYNDYYIDWHGRGAIIPRKGSKYLSFEFVDDDLIIYEKAGFCIFRYDLYISEIFVDTSSMPYKSFKTFDTNEECDIYVEKNISDFKTFKHTFKPNEETYFWFSTEVVE